MLFKKIIGYIACFATGVVSVLLFILGKGRGAKNNSERIDDCKRTIDSEIRAAGQTNRDIEYLSKRERELITRARKILDNEDN